MLANWVKPNPINSSDDGCKYITRTRNHLVPAKLQKICDKISLILFFFQFLFARNTLYISETLPYRSQVIPPQVHASAALKSQFVYPVASDNSIRYARSSATKIQKKKKKQTNKIKTKTITHTPDTATPRSHAQTTK